MLKNAAEPSSEPGWPVLMLKHFKKKILTTCFVEYVTIRENITIFYLGRFKWVSPLILDQMHFAFCIFPAPLFFWGVLCCCFVNYTSGYGHVEKLENIDNLKENKIHLYSYNPHIHRIHYQNCDIFSSRLLMKNRYTQVFSFHKKMGSCGIYGSESAFLI